MTAGRDRLVGWAAAYIAFKVLGVVERVKALPRHAIAPHQELHIVPFQVACTASRISLDCRICCMPPASPGNSQDSRKNSSCVLCMHRGRHRMHLQQQNPASAPVIATSIAHQGQSEGFSCRHLPQLCDSMTAGKVCLSSILSIAGGLRACLFSWSSSSSCKMGEHSFH